MATDTNTKSADSMTYTQFMKLSDDRNAYVASILNTYGKKYVIDDFYYKIKKKLILPDIMSIITYIPQFDHAPYSHRLFDFDNNAVKTACSEVADFIKANGFPYKVDKSRSYASGNATITCTFTK
jgi:hypothetical protein